MINNPKDRAWQPNVLPELTEENRRRAEEAEAAYKEFVKAKPTELSQEQVLADLSLAIQEFKKSIHNAPTLEKLLEQEYLLRHNEEAPVRQENRQLKAEIQRLNVRQDELLQTIRKLSATVPFQDEVDNWQSQRASMIAEIGTLRARIKELES